MRLKLEDLGLTKPTALRYTRGDWFLREARLRNFKEERKSGAFLR